MLRQAIGFDPGRSLLSGLRGTSGYGKAMAAASQLSLEADKANKGHMLKEAEAESQQRQKATSNNAQKQMSAISRNDQQKSMFHKRRMGDLGVKQGYQQLNKRKKTDQKQAVLGSLLED